MKNYKQIVMLPLIIGMLFTLLLGACTKAQYNKPLKSDNYVILLDLSDRLLAPYQDKQDIATIISVYEKFEKYVYNKLIINSKDKFFIRILPQDNSPVKTDSINNLLMIDMEHIPMKNKKTAIEQFGKKLVPTLEYIYRTAVKGKTHSDYQGVDIWKYFNESLQFDLMANYTNHLIILTDGYFDFESFNPTWLSHSK